MLRGFFIDGRVQGRVGVVGCVDGAISAGRGPSVRVTDLRAEGAYSGRFSPTPVCVFALKLGYYYHLAAGVAVG